MSYLLPAIDVIPDQTLEEVMLEIAESRERARMVDPDELRVRVKRRLSLLKGHIPDYRRGKREAYMDVLRWLDELEGP